MHLAAVLGHSPAGDANPVIEKPIADLRIAKRVAGGALIADDLLNDVFDAERGRKKIAHGDDFSRGKHDELAGHGAAACRFVDPERIRDLAPR